MSHVILIALTIDNVGTADANDLAAGVLARLDEFYPTDVDVAVPSYRTATVVAPDVAHHIDDALAVGLGNENALGDRAMDACSDLDLRRHGGAR